MVHPSRSGQHLNEILTLMLLSSDICFCGYGVLEKKLFKMDLFELANGSVIDVDFVCFQLEIIQIRFIVYTMYSKLTCSHTGRYQLKNISIIYSVNDIA